MASTRKGVTRTRARSRSTREGVTRTGRGNEEENELENAIENYETRIAASGLEEEADTRNALEKFLNLPEDQNFLFDIAEIIGRPQQALFGAINAAQNDEDVAEAALEGLKGERYTYAGEILRDAGIGDDDNGPAKFTDPSTWGIDDILGFGLDIFADPVDLALIPVTGGANVAVKAATDNVQNLNRAVDAGRSVNLVRNASKVGEISDVAREAAGLTKTLEATVPYTYRTTLLNLAGRAAKSGIKKGAGAVDNVIENILGKADNVYLNNLLKQATEQGIPVTEDMLKSADINSLLYNYNYLKNSIRNTFDYAKALPGNLVNKARQAGGSARQAANRARVILQDANQRLDDYVYGVLKSQGVDLTDFDDYFRNADNINIDNYLNNVRQADNFADIANDPDSLYNVIYNAKNQASLDVRDLIESGMDTSINGRTVLSNLSKAGKDGIFLGSQDSVESIARYLDSHGITYKTGVDPQGLGYTLKVDRNSKNLQALRTLQNSQEAIDAFNDMGLYRSLGYTADDINRVNQLKKNADLQTLASSVEKDYDDIADIFGQELGVDFSGITNRPGYVRRALADGYSPFDSTYDAARNAGRGNYSTQAFTSREYPYPTMVTERIKSGDMSKVGETVRAQGATGRSIGLNEQQIKIENVNREIDRLMSRMSIHKKGDLEDAKSILEERLEATLGPSKTELKLDKQINNAINKEQKYIDTVNSAKASITEEVINKMESMPASSATKNFMKKSQKFGAADKAYKDYLKEFTKKFSKKGTFTEVEYNRAFEKLNKLEQARTAAAYDIQAATSRVMGAIDDDTRAIIKTTDEAFATTDTAYKALNDTTVRKEALAARKELAKSARQELHDSLARKLKNVEDEISNLVNTDSAVLLERDNVLYSRIQDLEKTLDVLASKEGTKLFDDNYITGMSNFIDYASKNARGAKIYNEALAVGSFYDDNLVLRSQNALPDDLIPKNMIKLDNSTIGKMRAQLESVRGILPDNTNAIDNLIGYLSDTNVYMDRNLVNLLNFGTRKEVNPILKLVNGFNNVFKRFSVFTPGFHLRNIVGNTVNLALSGVPVSQIPDLYRRAARLVDDDTILDLIRKANAGTLTIAEQADYNLIQQFVSNGFYRAGTQVQDLGEIVSRTYNATEEPLTSIRQLSDAVGGSTLGKVKAKTIDRATDFSAMINDKLDSLNRMAALIYGNEHPAYFRKLGFDNAADAVRYSLFDPGNMSPTELETIKKIIPFYTFTKQNMIYQVTNAAKNSSRYHQLIKAFDITYDNMDEDSYRDYQKENFQLPLPFEDEDGNTIMLKMNLPVNDLTIFSSPRDVAQRIVSSTTPLIRAPFEQVSGVDMYTGEEIYRSGIEQLASYLGIANLTTNVWDKIEAIISRYNGDVNSTEMWTEIFNSLAQYNNQEKIRNSNLYEEMEYYSDLVSSLKDQGIEVPTINELTNTSSTRLTQLQRQRNKRNNSN